MQYIKQQIDQGNVELARLNGNNKAVPMEYSQLQQKRDILNKRGLILQKLKTLSQDQKQEWINFKRLRGNQLYKAQKWSQASQTYIQSLLGLDGSGKNSDLITKSNNELKYPIMLNIATCLYKMKEFKGALVICNKILQENDGKNFTKAYYKKAYTLFANGNYQQAKKASFEGIKVLQRNNNSSKNVGKQISKGDFIKLINEIDIKMTNEKSVYTKMFKKEDQEQQQQSENLIKGQEQKDTLIYKDTLWDRLTFCCRTTYRRLRSAIPTMGKGKST